MTLSLAFTMPRPSKKSAQAKRQRRQAENKFNQIQYPSDSGLAYTASSQDGVSSDESITATQSLYSNCLPEHLKPNQVCDLNSLLSGTGTRIRARE